MKARFEERFGGANRGRTGVLMGGAKAEPYGFSARADGHENAPQDPRGAHRSRAQGAGHHRRVGCRPGSLNLLQLPRGERDVRREDA